MDGSVVGRRQKLYAVAFLLVAAGNLVGPRGASGEQPGGFISWDDMRPPWAFSGSSEGDEGIRVIVVSPDGGGDSTTVQGAVDLVPHGNQKRVKIVILPGIYKWGEKRFNFVLCAFRDLPQILISS